MSKLVKKSILIVSVAFMALVCFFIGLTGFDSETNVAKAETYTNPSTGVGISGTSTVYLDNFTVRPGNDWAAVFVITQQTYDITVTFDITGSNTIYASNNWPAISVNKCSSGSGGYIHVVFVARDNATLTFNMSKNTSGNTCIRNPIGDKLDFKAGSYTSTQDDFSKLTSNTQTTAIRFTHNHSYSGKITKVATCTESGVKTYTCSGCSSSYTETIKPLGHDFNNYVSDDNATCIKDGTKTSKCSRCSATDTITDVGSKTGHKYGEPTYIWEGKYCTASRVCLNDRNHVETERVEGIYIKDTNATCETCEKGHYMAMFSGGAFTRQATAVNSVDNGKPLGHDFNNYVSNNDATCIKDGTKTSKCSRCEKTDTITDEGSKLGHDFNNYVSNNDATCTEDGTKTSKCSRCEKTDTITDVGSKFGHNYDAPTYSWEGKYCTASRVCLNDRNHVETERVEGVYVKDTDATCEICEKGHYVATFSSEAFTEQVTAKDSVDYGKPLGHNFDNYVSNNDATCIKDGTKTSKCSRCEETDTVTDVDSKLGHDFDNYVSNNDATCTQDGTKTSKCSRCEEADTVRDVDSATGHLHTIIINEVKATTESKGYTGDVFCTDCNTIIEYGTETPKLTAEKAKDEIKDMSKKDIPEDLPEEEKEKLEEINNKVEDAIEKIDEQTMLEIADVVNPEMNKLQAAMESGEITKEEYEEKVEIVEAVLQSSIVIGSKMDNAQAEAQEIMEKIPQDCGIDMGGVLGDFYQRQYALLLNNGSDQTTPMSAKKTNSVSLFGIKLYEEQSSGGIDFTTSAETYQNAINYVETSVEHMTDAVLLIRNCSGEAMKTEINDYVNAVSYTSFKDFDKEAADREFVQNAYKAIMLYLQQQVLTSLEQEYEAAKSSGNYKGTALKELEENYNTQVANVNDYETFEIMILEVMRQKYITVLNQRYENELISFEEYSILYEGASDVELFVDKYNEIFENWALNKEDDSGITLEEVSNSIIGDTKKATVTIEPIDGLSKGEVTLFLVIGGLLLACGTVALVAYLLKKSRKGGVEVGRV